MLDDRAREPGPDAGDAPEQVIRRGVHVDADLVDAGVDHVIEALLEPVWRHVVLVLPDTDALRVDLHQLGERILQAARDRDRAAHGDVELGELLARGVAGAVDAGAGFADHHHRHVDVEVAERLAHEGFGLAAGGPVADGDRADAALLHEIGQHRSRRRLARGRLEVHEPRAEVAPRGIDDGELAAGAQARIDPEHRVRAERRRQQQLADVVGEHADGRRVGHLAQRLVDLGLDRRRDVRAQREARGPLEDGRAGERCPRRRAGGGLERPDELVDEGIGDAVVGERPAQRQHELLLHPATPHRQVAVRGLRA